MDAAGTLTADTNTIAMDMDVQVDQEQQQEEQQQHQPQQAEEEEEEELEIDDDVLLEDEEEEASNVAAAPAVDASSAAAAAAGEAMEVVAQHDEGANGAPSASSSAAASSSASSSTALTIAEANELLETALALPVPDPMCSKGKRDKAVGKSLVAYEAAHAAEGVEENAVKLLYLHQQACEVITAWRATLTLGTDVDACSLRDDNWYAGTLLAERSFSSSSSSSSSSSPSKKTAAAAAAAAGSKSWEVKFKRFANSHNEKFAQTGPELLRLYPLGTYTGARPVSQRVLAEKRQRAQKAQDREEARRLREVSFVQPTLPPVVGTTRSGRAVRSENATIVTAAPVAKRAKKEKNGKEKGCCAHGGGKEGGNEGEEAEEGEQQGNHIDTGGNDQNDWVCGTCEEMGKSEGDRLVLCDGLCKRSFHQSCLGLSSEEVEALETWFCDQCLEKEHTCFVCGDTGKDDGAVDGVHKCMKANCGKFYHAHCVSQLPNAVVSKQQQQQQQVQEGGEEAGTGEVRFKFVCPMHVCDLCGKGRGGRELFPCWMCPKAYHLNCIPPSCKYHEYLLLCPEHSEEMELPRLPGWGEEE